MPAALPEIRPWRGPVRAAAFFDLDKTVIAKSSALTFSKPFYRGGLINRRAVLRSAYAQFVYLAGGADADQMERMRKYLSELCVGWDITQVREIIAETLHELIDPLIYDEAADLIEDHHLAGRDVVIVSTSGSEIVTPIGELLGADRVIATRMAVDDDGLYTGEIEFYAYAENKAQAMREFAEAENIDLARSYAYSDSGTDVPMLEAVGHPHAVNPDRSLRKEAAGRDGCSANRSRCVRGCPRFRVRAARWWLPPRSPPAPPRPLPCSGSAVGPDRPDGHQPESVTRFLVAWRAIRTPAEVHSRHADRSVN